MSTKDFRKVRVFSSRETENGSQIYRLDLRISNFDENSVRPGQFVAMRPENEAKMIRPFSIAGTHPEGIYLYVQTVGDVNSNSRILARSRGKIVEFSGPHGKPFKLISGVEEYLLVAGKTGVAGLLLVAKEIKAAGKKVKFLIGAKREEELIGANTLAGMGIFPEHIFNDGSLIGGEVTKLLEETLKEKKPDTAIIACGPNKMLKAVYDLAWKDEVPCLVSVELTMACATNSCKGCAVPVRGDKFKNACEDGPIFDAYEIDWDKFLPAPTPVIVKRFPKTQPADPLAVILYGQDDRRFELNSVCFNGSGSLGAAEAQEKIDAGMGAYTTKGVSWEETLGNPFPRTCEVPKGMINSIGLQNIGLERFIAEELPIWLSLGMPLIINICARSCDEFERIIRRLEAERLPPTVAYELNVSCPNVKEGGMLIGVDPHAISDVMISARTIAPRRFMTVKLTPNVTDVILMAGAAKDGGADAVTACNTLVAMDIDEETRRPKLGRVVGGLSGPCMLPIILAKARQIRQAFPELSIIYSGGATCGRDALKCLINGANAVTFATALFTNKRVCGEANSCIFDYCRRHGIAHSQDLVDTLLPAV
jgi:dihydroorotate dehydrogenase (NAD+) catalytic subunit